MYILRNKITIMRTIFTLILIFISSITFAQIYEVKKGSRKIEDKQRDVIQISLAPDGKSTSRAIRRYFRNEHDVRLSLFGWRNRYAENISLPRVTSENLNIYFNFKDDSDQSEFYVAMSYNENFLTHQNNPLEFANMDTLLNEFLKEFLSDYLNEKIDALNNEISRLDKSLKKARKNLKKNQKKIDKNKSLIKKLTKENEDLTEENQELNETIQVKEKKVESKSTDLVRERESLERTIKSLRRD